MTYKKKLIICALVLLVVSCSLGQTNVNDNLFDPRPTIPPYIPTDGAGRGPATGGQQPKPDAPPPSSDNGLNSVKREISGYELGGFVHKSGLAFCNNLADEIRDLVASGQKINMILVKGFADGKPNKGVRYVRSSIPAPCQPDASVETLNDVALARMRACIIQNLLTGMIDPKYASSIAAWQMEQYDEPDYGFQGYAYRKVSVEVFLDKGE